ncbi:hypothetical protein ABZX40_17845 [Streptomyces sp. NPDC004610]
MLAIPVAGRNVPPSHRARPSSPPGVFGALFVDLEGVRARYECLRPGCPRPVEGPVHGADVKSFVDDIKTNHLSRYHREHR